MFGRTKIGMHPTENRNKYLILKFDFSNVKVEEGESVKESFHNYVNRVVKKFSYNYGYHTKGLLKEQVIINTSDSMVSLGRLFDVVELSIQKIYLICDEYDSFANRLMIDIDTSTADGGYKQYVDHVKGTEGLLRNWGAIVKAATTSNTVARMYFTGVTPVAFADCLSSLNIVMDYSNDKKLQSMFGFHESDVRDALMKVKSEFPENIIDVEEHLNVLKSNFNGYRFNEDQVEGIYNPQHCLRYLILLQRDGIPPKNIYDENILGASDNVAQFILRNKNLNHPKQYTLSFFFDITSVNMFESFRHQDLYNPILANKALYSLAYFHGYLTHKDPALLTTQLSKQVSSNGVFVCPNEVAIRSFLGSVFALGGQGLSDEEADTILKKFKKATISQIQHIFQLAVDESVKTTVAELIKSMKSSKEDV